MKDIAEAVSTANKLADIKLLCINHTAKYKVEKKLAEKRVILESV